MQTFTLADDGTLDTVITCQECGQDERYTFQADDSDQTYDEFVTWCMEDAAESHECAS